jgi:hypothetical protein
MPEKKSFRERCFGYLQVFEISSIRRYRGFLHGYGR